MVNMAEAHCFRQGIFSSTSTTATKSVFVSEWSACHACHIQRTFTVCKSLSRTVARPYMHPASCSAVILCLKSCLCLLIHFPCARSLTGCFLLVAGLVAVSSQGRSDEVLVVTTHGYFNLRDQHHLQLCTLLLKINDDSNKEHVKAKTDAMVARMQAQGHPVIWIENCSSQCLAN
jgi:hypothetical protein